MHFVREVILKMHLWPWALMYRSGEKLFDGKFADEKSNCCYARLIHVAVSFSKSPVLIISGFKLSAFANITANLLEVQNDNRPKQMMGMNISLCFFHGI